MLNIRHLRTTSSQRLVALSGDDRTARLPAIVAAADAVLAVVDATAVACHVAAKSPAEGRAAAAVNKAMDEQKSALIEALEAKAWALLDMHPEAPGAEQQGQGGDAFEEVFGELRRWVDTGSAPYALLAAKREARRGRCACAIKVRARHLVW